VMATLRLGLKGMAGSREPSWDQLVTRSVSASNIRSLHYHPGPQVRLSR